MYLILCPGTWRIHTMPQAIKINYNRTKQLPRNKCFYIYTHKYNQLARKPPSMGRVVPLTIEL